MNLIKKNTIENNKQASYNNHQKELDDLEKDLQKDLNEVIKFFEDKLNSFLTNAKKQEVYLFEKHRKELEDYIDKLEKSISKNVKYSRKYLDLKCKEKSAAKSEKFLQANYYKKQCDSMEKDEFERFNINRNKKIQSMANILRDKQNKETSSLKQKFDREYEELQFEKKNRITYTIQNYTNKKRKVQNDFRKSINILNNKSKIAINYPS